MAFITKDERVNSKMSKLNFVLKEHLIGNDNNNVEWILERLGNLNDKIQSTKFLRIHNPEWIGCTVLHLAALNNQEIDYQTLLEKGADCTILNDEGASPLHIVMEKNYTEGKRYIPYFLIGHTMSAHLRNKNFENPSDRNGLSHLHIACMVNKVELVEQFLNHGALIDQAVNMNSTRFPGYTALHCAADHRCLEVTKVLLSHGADTQIKDAKGMTSLHMLLKTYLEIADPVSVEKYKCNGPDEGDELILEWARKPAQAQSVTQKLIGMIKLFLHHESQDSVGLSKLHLACTLRELNETERYIQKATKVNHHVDMNSTYWPGYTPSHFAAHFDLDTVKLLLEHGANMGAKDARGVTPFDVCLRRYEPSDIHTIISLVPDWKKIVLSDGKTKLLDVIHAMTEADRFKKFLRRLSRNLCVHVPNNSPLWAGFSLLHLAVVVGKIDDHKPMLPVLEELLDRAPALLRHQEVRGWTPLHLAYRLQKDNVTEVLINYHLTQADFSDIFDVEGLSHTHIASTTENIEYLLKLLRNGSDVNAVFRGTSMTWRGIPPGATPLHFAVVHDVESAMDTLLYYDVDVYAKDANGMTPIHLMAVVTHKDNGYRRILLNLEDLEDSVMDDVGLSHLHVACLCGHYVSTNTLVENGANVRQRLSTELTTIEGLKGLNEWRGCTPLDIALKKGYQSCVDSFVKNDPEFFVNNYNLIPEFLMERYACFVDLSRLMTDVELKARLENDFGITSLHLACWDYFFERENFADVNTRVREDSTIWPGWTPVHVLLSNAHDYFSSEAIDRFVEAGIDATLANVDGETAVHFAYKEYRKKGMHFYLLTNVATKLHSLINTLLQSQTDLSINPTSIDGTTHFHIACAVGNANVVEKFLQRGLVDVNRPIDFFHETEAGQTPLQLAARASIKDASMRLRTVDLLLKNGADVNAESSCGNTALHECALAKFVDVFARIAKEGADVNARNILGHPPLKYFLSEEKISIDEINKLLILGCHFNAFNPINEDGCLGRALCSIPIEDIGNLVSTLKDHRTSLIDADDKNRTIIHNIAASADVIGEKYVPLIAELSKIGYDVDDKDKIGRTPLHLAARTQNVQGIVALLASGADVNLTDTIGVTILGYCLRDCYRCRDLLEDLPDIAKHYDIDDDDEDDWMPCRHVELLKLLAIHVKKLLYCGLDVSEDCIDCLGEVTDMSHKVRMLSERFFVELEAVKKVTIGSQKIPISELLTENGVVVDYPTMSVVKRSSIDDFFRSTDINIFRGGFQEVAGIVQLQYRKAVARVDLAEKAKDSLMILAGIRLDDLCSRIILKMLKNSEWRSLNAAASNEENAWG